MSRKTGKTAVARGCMKRSGPALAGDGVERALQDVGGGHLVYHLPAPLAGHVGLADPEALDRGAGEALVPERDGLGEAGLLHEVARELAHRLAARTPRSEASSVGKEGVSTCSCRGGGYH